MSLFRKLAFCSKSPSTARGQQSEDDAHSKRRHGDGSRDAECAVCQEPPTKPCTVPCGNQHVFCLACLQGIVQHNHFHKTFPCPLCRKRVKIPARGLNMLKNEKGFGEKVLAKLPTLRPHCSRGGGSGSASSTVSSTWLPPDVLQMLGQMDDVPVRLVYVESLSRRHGHGHGGGDASLRESSFDDSFSLDAVDVELQLQILEQIQGGGGGGVNVDYDSDEEEEDDDFPGSRAVVVVDRDDYDEAERRRLASPLRRCRGRGLEAAEYIIGGAGGGGGDGGGGGGEEEEDDDFPPEYPVSGVVVDHPGSLSSSSSPPVTCRLGLASEEFIVTGRPGTPPPMPIHHARRSLYSDDDDNDDDAEDEVSGWSLGSVVTSRSGDGDGEESAAMAAPAVAAGTDMDLHAPPRGSGPASSPHVTRHHRDNNHVRNGVSGHVASSTDNAPAQGQPDVTARTSPPPPYQQSSSTSPPPPYRQQSSSTPPPPAPYQQSSSTPPPPAPYQQSSSTPPPPAPYQQSSSTPPPPAPYQQSSSTPPPPAPYQQSSSTPPPPAPYQQSSSTPPPPAPYQQSDDDLDMAVVMQLIADIDGLSGGGDSDEEEEEEEEASSPGAAATTTGGDWKNVPHHWIPRPTLEKQNGDRPEAKEEEGSASRFHPRVNPSRNDPGDRQVYRSDSYRAAAEQCYSAGDRSALEEDSPPAEHQRGLATWRHATPGALDGHRFGSDTKSAPAEGGVRFERSAGGLGEMMMMNADSGMVGDRAGDRLGEERVATAGELVLGEEGQSGSSDTSRVSGSVNSRQAGRGHPLDQFKNSQGEESQRKQSKKITVITV